jgi:preprotein translocase subunit SecG
MNWVNIGVMVHVLIALAIIGLVLLQHGKGADMGSGFGGGASASLFGATGSANFLSRATAVLATVFFASSLALAYFGAQPQQESGSVVDRAPAVEKKVENVKPAPEPVKPPAGEKSVPQ